LKRGAAGVLLCASVAWAQEEPPPAPSELPPVVSPVAVSTPPPAPPEPTPRLLALCESVDVVARTYCIEELERAADPRGLARGLLSEMAMHDEELHDRAAALHLHLYGEASPAFEVARARRGPEGDPNRVVYAPTGFTRRAGDGGVNLFELGTFALDYGVTDEVQIGIQSAIPIGIATLGAIGKVGAPFEGGAASLTLNAIGLFPFVDGGDDPLFVYGGGPSFTIGDRRSYVNLGGLVYFFSVGRESVTFALPHIGGSYMISKRVRLGGEIYFPMGLSDDTDPALGEFVAVLWGVRIFGDAVWGDIALFDPICDGCEEIYRVIPLGIPFLNIGFGF